MRPLGEKSKEMALNIYNMRHVLEKYLFEDRCSFILGDCSVFAESPVLAGVFLPLLLSK